jgi:hypothetical protein
MAAAMTKVDRIPQNSSGKKMTRHRMLLPAIICLSASGAALAANASFDGTYSGKRVLTNGSEPPCVGSEGVSVVIGGGTLTFTNSALRNYAVGFDPAPDGKFGELHIDAGGKAVAIRGRIVGSVLDADVADATCEHRWHLLRQ